jgi:hypothetical protein
MSSTVVTTGESTAIIINLLISLVLVALIGALIYTQLPRIEKMIKEKLAESLVRNSKNKGNQPLTQIFLGYNHKSVKEWIQFITAQELDTKIEAFDNLKKYLEVETDEMGAVTSDIVFAIANFGFDDCVDNLIKFCKHVRDDYISINSLEIYYKAATQSISRFELDRAREFLQDELMLLKNKRDYELLERDVLMALGNIEPSPELEEFWVQVLTHRSFSQRIKEEALIIVQRYTPESQNNVISKSLSYFVNAQDLTLSPDDRRVIELFFGIGCKFLKDGVEDVWKLSIEGVKKDHCKDLFIQLLSSVLSNKDFKLTEEQMQAVIYDSVAGPIFRDILTMRFGISDSEKTIFKRDFELSYYEEIRNNTIKFFKPGSPKSLNFNFAEDYDFLNDKLSASSSKRKSQDSSGVRIISGTGELDKLYMVDVLAANSNRAFVYINSKTILNSIADISKLKPNLENNKPCVVFLDKFFETITEGLDKTQETNLVNLAKTIIDSGKIVGIDFVANVRVSQETAEQNSKLQEASEELFEKRITYLKEINLPDEDERQKVINFYKEKLDPSRDLNSDLENTLMSNGAGVSKMAFVTFLQEYFEKTLLVYGELRNPSEVNLS